MSFTTKVTPKLDLNKINNNSISDFDKPELIINSVGMAGDDIPEIRPAFVNIQSEILIEGKQDCTIVLGRDRVSDTNGYGLSGETSCASIDLVVGRKACDPNFNIKTSQTGPSFIEDAARVYISQKSDIDDALGIPAGKSGISIARSSTAVKSDSTRIVGRESLKLVVGSDLRNSLGGLVTTQHGVELIRLGPGIQDGDRVMNIETIAENQIREIELGGMQPMTLGINTAFAFDQLAHKLQKLCSVVSTFAITVVTYASKMGTHIHEKDVVPLYFGIPPGPSTQAVLADIELKTNLLQYTINDISRLHKEIDFYKTQHLTPVGPYYINSKYHTLN